MDNASYRVVLTGGLVSGHSREAVIAALARLLETSAARLIPVFEEGEHPIENLLDAAEAAELQQTLEALGARARVDRVTDTAAVLRQHSGLRLPNRQDPAEAGLMRCPACGHEQLVAERCDECGVVFAEFHRQQRAAPDPRPSGPVRAEPGPVLAPRRRRDHDIHAYANAQWQGDWLPEDEPPTEQYHVNLFMGPDSTALADACGRMMLGRRTHLGLSWAGGAVFSPFIWAMYRKMWAWGTLIFFVEVLLPVLLITLGAKPELSNRLTYVGLGLLVANRVFWPALLKSLYCRHARRTIAYMHRLAPTYAADIDIATRGGTSKTSVFVGLVIALVVTLLSWSVVDSLYPQFLLRPQVVDDPLPVATTEDDQVAESAPTEERNQRLVDENNWMATRTRMRLLARRLSSWHLRNGAGVDMTKLRLADFAREVGLSPEGIRDSWGREFYLEVEGDSFRLVTAGPDGKFRTADDAEFRRMFGR